MSFGTCHMAPQHRIDGVRGKHNQVVSYIAAYIGLTWENLRDVYYDGQEWDVQLMGNSKFVDSHIWAAFLKCFFNKTRASRLIGFALSEPEVRNTIAIDFRLKRINTKSFLKLSEAAIAAGLVDNTTIRRILMIELPYKKAAIVKTVRSQTYRYFAKRLVMEALAEATVIPGGPTKTRQVATRLNVPLDTVRYWRDLVTPDVMVHPQEE